MKPKALEAIKKESAMLKEGRRGRGTKIKKEVTRVLFERVHDIHAV
jgi:hypothetical protein